MSALFAQKFLKKISILNKSSKAGNILLENLPNFFVEHVTESQNQPYCFKKGKTHISMGKLAKNVSKF